MKFLQPIPLKHEYFSPIEKEIRKIFNDMIYRRLRTVIEKYYRATRIQIINATSALSDAVRNGTIWYEDGAFHGRFNARTSKELLNIGASYNKKSRTYSLPFAEIPADVRMAQADANMRYDQLRRSLVITLDEIDVNQIDEISDVKQKYKKTVWSMNKDFEKTVRAAAIPPKLTDAQRDRIANEWGQNLDKYIKNWTEENILKLRREIQQNTFSGYRSSSLVKAIQQNYAVSIRKAKFLARQETSLLMSKFHEARYRDCGINKYKWSGVMDARERIDHRELEGKIFSWDQPPIVDKKNGRRGNPGEDYGCRCIAIPVLE